MSTSSWRTSLALSLANGVSLCQEPASDSTTGRRKAPSSHSSGGLVPLDLPNGMKSKSPILPLEMDGRRLGVGHRLPRIGEHTREILLGLGYAEAEIGRLVAEGVCRA